MVGAIPLADSPRINATTHDLLAPKGGRTGCIQRRGRFDWATASVGGAVAAALQGGLAALGDLNALETYPSRSSPAAEKRSCRAICRYSPSSLPSTKGRAALSPTVIAHLL
jgi:hypothetical protein